ncbi:MAG: N-acetyl-gamma-glutamyl-phosphate reductase, partial [Chloroflexi bacterium]|nr:N-acetyl-gamma-glutamyl-phosphate reductase [Chloroflexota bacterium]
MHTARVGIINVTSYMGAEVARLLHRHSGVEVVWVTGRSEAGKKLEEVFPHLWGLGLPVVAEPGDADVIVSALPPRASAEAVLPLVGKGTRVIDLSADFRLRDPGQYPLWYGYTHPAPGMLDSAVYGLPELHRSRIARSLLVANPGCYPTSVILGLAPVVKGGLIQPDIIADSKSGVSGAGRTLSLKTHYAEVNENVSAYSLEGHRHLAEMTQELESLHARGSLSVTFVPHLVPMTRGILSSCYARLIDGKLAGGEKGVAQLREVYREFYRGEPFVRVVDFPPQTKHAWGSNFCLIHPTIDLRTNRLVVISCLDNLVKGGSGQA